MRITGRRWPFLFFLTLILNSFTSFGAVDSLWAVWSDHARKSSERISALHDFIWQNYVYSDPDSAIKYGLILVAEAEKRGTQQDIGQSYKLLGVIDQIHGHHERAIVEYTKALDLFLRSGDSSEYGRTLYNLGNCMSHIDENSKSLELFTEGLSLFERLNDTPNIATGYQNLGLLFYKAGMYDRTLKYFEQAKRLYILSGDDSKLGSLFVNLGAAYFSIDSLDLAENYFVKGIEMKESRNDMSSLAIPYHNLGVIRFRADDTSAAYSNYKKALDLAIEVGADDQLIDTYSDLGELFAFKGEHTIALQFCKKAMSLADSFNSFSRKQKACRCMYLAMKHLGEKDSALYYHELVEDLEDSMAGEEINMDLLQVEFRRKELLDSVQRAEIQKHREFELQRERTLYIGGAVIILLLLAGSINRLLFVRRSREAIKKEKERSDSLLLNILPEPIAEELKQSGKAAARTYRDVSVLFSDFQNFTQIAERLTADQLLKELNICFKAFDEICKSHDLEKIKTIGDAYMAAGGLHDEHKNSVKRTILAGIDMVDFIEHRKKECQESGREYFEMRLGIHTGSVVAGIVGSSKFQYDLWGDTVNTASRMESSGEIGRVNISQYTYKLLKDESDLEFQSRGKVEAKGKGAVEMYFVRRKA